MRSADPINDFSTLFDFLPIGAYRSLPKGVPIRANPALATMNGFANRDEFLQAIQSVDPAVEWYVDPDRRATFLETIERDGQVTGFISEIYRLKTRERMWVLESAHLVRDAKGKALYYEGTIEDVTEQVRARAALVSAEAVWQEIAANLPVVVYRVVVQPDGSRQLSYCSDAVRSVYGVEPAQVIASERGLRQYIHPDDLPRVLADQDRATRDKAPLSQVFRILTAKNEQKWVQMNSSAVTTPGTAPCRVGVIVDITERQRAEVALRESEERWKLALESTGDGVWDVNLETGEETYSPRFLEMYGYGSSDVDPKRSNFDGRTHPDDVPQMQRDRAAHFAGRAPRYVNEHRVQCKDGSWKWVLTRGLVIRRDPSGRPLRMIGTHTDITAAKESEMLRRARDQAETANRAKTELLSRVSHELRTPLNGVLGFAQLLDHAEDMPERFRPWVAQILSSGRHLLGLVDDLLDLSSAQSGGVSLHLEPVDTSTVLRESWSMLEARATQAGVAFDATLPETNDLIVQADRRRMTQVFTNLLSNAVKYNRAGGKVQVQAARRGSQVEVQVVDTGLGMDKSQLARIFQPFERLGAEASGIEGTGLGLALSRQLVLAMRGEIRVTSQRDRGTTFTVTLPAA